MKFANETVDGECPLCRKPCKKTALPGLSERNIDTFACETCGYFAVNEGILSDFTRRNPSGTVVTGGQLASLIRTRQIGMQPRIPVILMSRNWGEINDLPVSYLEDIGSLGPRSLSERLDRYLVNLSKMFPVYGEAMIIRTATDYPLAYVSSQSECDYVLRQIQSKGWLTFNTAGRSANTYEITSNGWSHIDELQRETGSNSNVAFVAMSFDPAMNEVYDMAIEPAIRLAGYQAVRMDKIAHNNRIDHEIIAQIRKARFLVADFTGQKGGIYYEAGFAHGLNKEVFFCCRKDQEKDLHFDTRQILHILWTDTDELKNRLKNHIEAVLGTGPIKPGGTHS